MLRHMPRAKDCYQDGFAIHLHDVSPCCLVAGTQRKELSCSMYWPRNKRGASRFGPAGTRNSSSFLSEVSKVFFLVLKAFGRSDSEQLNIFGISPLSLSFDSCRCLSLEQARQVILVIVMASLF